MTPPAWPIRGVRVEEDTVIIKVKGGNDVARWLCGKILAANDPFPSKLEKASLCTAVREGTTVKFYVDGELMCGVDMTDPDVDQKTIDIWYKEEPLAWVGCGDCDVSFPCHNGQAKCLRLNNPGE